MVERPQYGALSKDRSLAELQTIPGIETPLVFTSLEDAEQWKNKGGHVIVRPHFINPWDSAIFLPGLDSKIFMWGGLDMQTELDYYSSEWEKYLVKLKEGGRLQRYLEAFGVDSEDEPKLSYILQALVFREDFSALGDFPSTTRAIAMRNGDSLHVETQNTGAPTKSGTYYNGELIYGNYPNRIPSAQLGPFHDSIAAVEAEAEKTGHSNLQIELTYGRLLPEEEERTFVVQHRDFPQMGRSPHWHYLQSSNLPFHLPQVANYYELFPDMDSMEFRVNQTIDMPKDPRHILTLNYPPDDDDLLNLHEGLDGLVIRGRFANVPLNHGLFSLIELARLRRKPVLFIP